VNEKADGKQQGNAKDGGRPDPQRYVHGSNCSGLQKKHGNGGGHDAQENHASGTITDGFINNKWF